MFIKFLKIGAIGFGGGWPILRLIEEEVVVNSRWLTNEEFGNIVAVAASIPGPVALNTATYIGYKMGGILGSAAAVIGIILVPFTIIILAAYGLTYYLGNVYVRGFLNGLKAVVLGLFIMSLYSTLRITVFSLNTIPQALVIVVLTLAFVTLMYYVRLDPIIAVLITGLLGVLATVFKVW